VEAYRLYYRTGRIRPLAEYLFWYDFSDYDAAMAEAAALKAAHRRDSPGDPVTLNSSGTTTGVSTPYPFRPVSMLAAVEVLLKNPLAAPLGVWVREAHQHAWRSPDTCRPGGHLGRVQFNLKLADGGTNAAALVGLLRSSPDQAAIYCRPNAALTLSRDPAFSEYLGGGHNLLCLATSDWEPAYDAAWFRSRGVYVNDNMIDWQTGLNFYTCPNGGRHFLPMFHGRGAAFDNLLNLEQDAPATAGDDAEVTGPERCVCGRRKLGLRFVPHHSIQIPRYAEVRGAVEGRLMPQLRSQLAYIQFVEGEAGLGVLYYRVGGGDLDPEEKDAVRECLGEVSFSPGDFTFCGLGKVCPYMRDNGRRLPFVGRPAAR
jgi:hypothetical protein